MTKTVLLSLLFFPLAIFGQVTITGKVISQTDTKPVENASVYLSNATVGSTTAADGTFTLKNAKPGNYDLIISIVGFDSYDQKVVVTDKDINLNVITIFPKSTELNEVKITYKKDPERRRYFVWFKQEFLGSSELSKDCKILNPEVLDYKFDGKSGVFTATTDDFLVIENDALGYKLKYMLNDFVIIYGETDIESLNYSGNVLFEELKGTLEQQREWKKRRLEVYLGSQAHFLHSVLANRLNQDGFRVLRLPANINRPTDSLIQEKITLFTPIKKGTGNKDSLRYWQKKAGLPKYANDLVYKPLKPFDIITGPDKQGFYTLSANGDALHVTYNQYHHFNTVFIDRVSSAENKNSSLVYFDVPKVLFDKNGSLIHTTDLTYSGIWGKSRISTLLPTDYEPKLDNNEPIETDSVLTNGISAKLNSYAVAHPIEKAYLQFDKSYYATGDTIYFKAYVTSGGHRPSQLSGILNVDLIDGADKISRSLKLQLIDGLAWGDFALPDTLEKGNYRVRAYTNLMRNEDSKEFFDTTLPVGSLNSPKMSESTSPRKKEAVAPKPDVQFFAEGGNLLDGVLSKIAFKAIGPDGLATDIKGIVLDENNKQVITFASNNLGMGVVAFTPKAGKAYRADITYVDGSSATIALPSANDNGYQLNIDNTDSDVLTARVSAGKQDVKTGLSLVAQSGGTVYYSVKCNPDKKEFTVNIAKSELPTGVVQFTLFTSTGVPLNERLVFINNNDQLNVGLSTARKTYQPRQKVKIDLDVTNHANEPVTGNFSIAVTDETKVPFDEKEGNNILSNLLLTSELKGTVEKPNYYFANTNDKTNADLDALMLTQGYRSFDWKRILNDDGKPLTYQPEKSFSISGRVHTTGGKPIPNGKVTLFTTKGGSFLLDTLTDANGRFAFNNLVFADSTKFVVQLKVAKGQDNVVLDVDTLLPPQVIPVDIIKGRALKVNNNASEIDMTTYLQNSKQFSYEQQKYGINKHELLLKEVVIKDQKGPDYLQDSQNLNGRGKADQTLTANDFATLACGNIMDCLQSRMHAVKIMDGKIYATRNMGIYWDPELKKATYPPMLLVIDGIVNRYDALHSLTIDAVASIEVMLSTHYAAIYGSQAAYGAVVITTKRAYKINNYFRYAPGVVTIMPKGYYMAREFYSPKYDNPKTNQQIRDLRSTIYWKADITTGKDGKASVEFFNADSKGTYKVIMEGIDADGNLARQVYRYNVE